MESNKKIKDIKVVGPEDKLLIMVEGTPMYELAALASSVEDFMINKNRPVLVLKNMQPYIIKKGAKISLAAVFEQMLDKEGK